MSENEHLNRHPWTPYVLLAGGATTLLSVAAYPIIAKLYLEDCPVETPTDSSPCIDAAILWGNLWIMAALIGTALLLIVAYQLLDPQEQPATNSVQETIRRLKPWSFATLIAGLTLLAYCLVMAFVRVVVHLMHVVHPV